MLLVRDASLCRRPFCGNIFWGHIAERFWGVEYVSKNFKRTKYGRRNKSIPPRKCRQIQTTRTTTIITLITPWRQRTLNKIFEILSWSFNGVVHRWHINIPWLPITNRIWQLILQQSWEHLHVFQQHDWSTNSTYSGLPMYICFYF